MGLSEQVEYERSAYERSAEYTNDTYGPAYDACLLLSSTDQPNCEAKANEEYRKNTRDEQDLIAQQTTAVWTFLMGCAAIIGMMLSALGVVLVWTTFTEPKKANEIARHVADADLRPWLDLKIIARNATLALEDLEFLVNAEVKNIGRSPAINVCVDVICRKMDADRISDSWVRRNDPPDKFSKWIMKDKVGFSILPSSNHFPGMHKLSIEASSIIFDKIENLYFIAFEIDAIVTYQWNEMQFITGRTYTATVLRPGEQKLLNRMPSPGKLMDVDLALVEFGLAYIT